MFKKIYPFVFIFLFLFASSAHAGFWGDVGGSLFGGVGSFIGNGIDSAVSVVTSFVSAVAAPVVNAISSAVSAVSNIITGVIPQPPAPPPDKSSQLDNFDPFDNYNPTSYIGGAGEEVHVTSRKQPVRVTEVVVTELEFSEIHVANIRVESVLPDHALYGGVYAFVYTQLSNVGTAAGATKYKITMDCDLKNAFVGGDITRDFYESGWVQTKAIESGRTEEFVLIRWLDEEKFKYGGECEITSEISENVAATNLFQDFAGWIMEGLNSIWSLVTDWTETTVSTGQTQISATIKRTIMPRQAQLDAGLGISLIG